MTGLIGKVLPTQAWGPESGFLGTFVKNQTYWSTAVIPLRGGIRSNGALLDS